MEGTSPARHDRVLRPRRHSAHRAHLRQRSDPSQRVLLFPRPGLHGPVPSGGSHVRTRQRPFSPSLRRRSVSGHAAHSAGGGPPALLRARRPGGAGTGVGPASSARLHGGRILSQTCRSGQRARSSHDRLGRHVSSYRAGGGERISSGTRRGHGSSATFFGKGGEGGRVLSAGTGGFPALAARCGGNCGEFGRRRRRAFPVSGRDGAESCVCKHGRLRRKGVCGHETRDAAAAGTGGPGVSRDGGVGRPIGALSQFHWSRP
mmetsp:Transcript_24192/g.55026  ORF Transcript_24192/g.55026 Transcript_24192/m.55026 type:complete len:261 (+) Transcript_24192:852-1634(+)